MVPLDPARAVRIVTETARARDYAHEAGVLHRDVKPANILLEHPRPDHPGDPGRVLLADFGIAKALEHTQHLTKTGMLVASLQCWPSLRMQTMASRNLQTQVSPFVGRLTGSSAR